MADTKGYMIKGFPTDAQLRELAKKMAEDAKAKRLAKEKKK